jgi:uncharacterized protein (DUF924 family)
MNSATDVLNFWFSELKPKQWFMANDELDGLVRSRFADLHGRAARCELYSWRETPEGRLAEIIILDQFSRNMFRSQPRAFAYDPLALALAQEAVRVEADKKLNASQKAFLYLPYMHSESKVVHELAVELFRAPGLESNYDYELRHKAIIDRYGRYPHRNQILGRASTPEEIEFLKQPGSGF